MKNFVRLQKITDVVNRLSYIQREGKYSEKNLSEQLVLSKDFFGKDNWQKLADFETAESERLNANLNQARELIVALPNQMFKSPKAEEQYDQLANELAKDQPYAYAIHWNETKTNLHMHLLLAERQITQELEPKTYRQDYWKDKTTGKVCSKDSPNAYLYAKKGDIQRDKDGNIKYKDSKNSGFSLKNNELTTKAWLQDRSEHVRNALESFGYVLEQYDPNGPYLAEKHQGKGNNAYTNRIKLENHYIRKYNKEIQPLVESPYLTSDKLLAFKKETAQEFKQGIFKRVFTRIKAWLSKLAIYIQKPADKLLNSLQNATETIGDTFNELKRRTEQANRRILQPTTSYERLPGEPIPGTQSSSNQDPSKNPLSNAEPNRADNDLFEQLKTNYLANQIIARQSAEHARRELDSRSRRELKQLQGRNTNQTSERDPELATYPYQDNERPIETRDQREYNRELKQLRRELDEIDEEIRRTPSIRAKLNLFKRRDKLEDQLNDLNNREPNFEPPLRTRDDDYEMEL